MHLSKLTLNPRSREARRDLAAPYDLHRTLLRGFPDAAQGGPGRVLWRVDIDRRTDDLTVLVQSEKQPDWAPLEALDSYLLQPVESKQVELTLSPGHRLAFRLRANPTVKRDDKRLGLLREEEQLAWLDRKASGGGFRLLGVRVTPEGMVKSNRRVGQVAKPVTATSTGQATCPTGEGATMTFLAVRFDGVLEVTDPEAFLKTVENGIGSAKAFGFGLLSLAPAP
jgi:CRISPR system Cascade subunit CasE